MDGSDDLVFDNEGGLYITHVDFARTSENNYHAHVNQLQVNNYGTSVTMCDDYTVGDAYFWCQDRGIFRFQNYGGESSIFGSNRYEQRTLNCSKLVGSAAFNEENVTEFCKL